MESLKKLGEPLRQHFEKILLILVLLGLAGTVYYLFQKNQEEQETIREFFNVKTTQKTKPVDVIDLSGFENDRKRLQNPAELNLSPPHNLFNPVKWQRRPDGTLFKIQSGKEIGPFALVVQAIRPLNRTIAVDRPAGTGWWMVVTNELYPRRVLGHLDRQFASLTITNTRVFILRDMRPPENPSQWILELRDSGELVTVTREQPYTSVIGYEADLSYPVENKSFDNMRVGMKLRLSSEEYNIVAINQDEVLLSAVSNDRRYAIPFTGAP